MTDALAGKPQAEGGLEAGHGDSEANWLDRLRSRFGLGEEPTVRETLEEALLEDEKTRHAFSPQERTMLRNILRFGALRVDDVMVPRADVDAIDEQATLVELLRLFEDAGHSRIPVYRETLDDLAGMVHVKDLMAWITAKAASSDGSAQRQSPIDPAASMTSSQDPAAADPAAAGGEPKKPPTGLDELDLSCVDLNCTIAAAGITRDQLYVPPSMPVLDLLLRMQTTRTHLALVVDEYGGTDGLVSIEDLVEEIVGEIEDEHDVDDGPLITGNVREGFVADARTPIEDLEAALGAVLLPSERDEDVDTLGGLLFSTAGRVPARGELVGHPSGLEFEVLDADPRRIKKLRIHVPPGGLDPARKSVEDDR